jgi:hypothetical protein
MMMGTGAGSGAGSDSLFVVSVVVNLDKNFALILSGQFMSVALFSCLQW